MTEAWQRSAHWQMTEAWQRSAHWHAMIREMRLNPAELKVYKQTRRELLKRPDSSMLLRKAQR